MNIDRRSMLKLIAAAGAAGGIGAAAIAEPKRYGAVTVERHTRLSNLGVHLRVFHQGCDITRDCTFADDTGDGMAVRLLRNSEGKFYLCADRKRVAKETVYGVTMRERERVI